MTSAWTETDNSLFFSKNDPEDPRLGECVSHLGTSPLKSLSADMIIWGYPDHEGIQLNGGREGAALAPAAIRKVFYKMTPHVLQSTRPRLIDAGDISLKLPLAQRHEQGALLAQNATSENLAWVGLGGGHDYGYADGAGFLRAQIARGERPVTLNFDAHLDVRPFDKNLNSGTPFRRLLTEFSGQFDFIEVGLQPHCNSRSHWSWALSQGAKLIPLSETLSQGLLPCLKQVLTPFKGRPLWVSLDIDAITSNEAPGCSQSWTTGLQTADLMQSLEWMVENFQWRSFSIYEVSPPLDSDLRTVKLAALFLHRFLSLQMQSKNQGPRT
jgi:formiminoglutamase